MIVKLSAHEVQLFARIGINYVMQGLDKTIDLMVPDPPTRKIKHYKEIKKVASKMKRKPMSMKRRKEIGKQMKAYWAKRRKAA